MRAGLLDPANLLFARAHVTRVRDVAPVVHERLEDLDAACADIHREHPFQPAGDFAAALRGLLNRPEFKTILSPDWKE